MINVTRTFLPDKDEYFRVLSRAWDKGWITNNGDLVRELEERLKEYLGVKYLFFCANGTIVLQMALKALGITGEVVTSPYSYVATLNAILWEKCTPVFCDIHPGTLNIDVSKIEACLTPRTQAILVPHVYGYPCDIDRIAAIAARHKLKIIYDGAHAFGCRSGGRSLLSHGDVSTCSFHATKVFHTVEGGAVITSDDGIARKLMLSRQFGHVYDDYYSVGINAKNSEFHAAMGLCLLPKIDSMIRNRKAITETYDRLLAPVDLQRPRRAPDLEWNYGYYPVLFRTEEELLKVKVCLEQREIMPRRYFYPSLNTLPFLPSRAACPISESVSRRVLCLPLYPGLQEKEAESVAVVIREALC